MKRDFQAIASDDDIDEFSIPIESFQSNKVQWNLSSSAWMAIIKIIKWNKQINQSQGLDFYGAH